ncbi:MAG: carboxylesterase family protein [Lachnospiraceae bacterium]|nr:carboxylesterase family protein [Lachnospiraceae bacterium]
MENFIVKTENGLVQGVHGYDPRVVAFKGIPYAAPPVGKLRWRVPQPCENWEGIRMADKYPAVAGQEQPGIDPNSFWTKEMHPAGTELKVSEDCLYLNVFTPARKADEKLPVLFYIHGGGYRGGYPHEVEFDWEHMAAKGVVVVAIAYRLGILGFLANPMLSAEAPEEAKGNYGLMDQLAALKWVQRNIAAFGGDPSKVTIAGQSAGAMSVQNLITSPLAKGLMAGAIIESGLTINFEDRMKRNHPLAEGEALGAEIFEKAGIHSLEEARALPMEEVVMLEDKYLGPGIHFEPVIDGIVIKENNFDAYIHGNYEKIPVLVGHTSGEAASFARAFGSPAKTLAEFEEYAKVYGDKAEEFKSLCKVSSDADVEELMTSFSMLDMPAGVRLFGELQDAQGRTTYVYDFNADIPGEDNAGSYHGSELWFAYDALARCWRPFTGKHYDLARQVSSYWINFVKTGDPNGCDNFGNPLPRWEAFKKGDAFVMEFQDTPARSEKKIDPIMRFRIDYTLAKAK